MLSKQFFSRIQVAELLDFKSDSSIKGWEKQGIVTPAVKPCRYSLEQVLYMLICREAVKYSDFTWKDLHNIDFNFKIDNQCFKNSILSITQIKGAIITDISQDKDIYRDIKNTLKFLYQNCEVTPFALAIEDFAGKNTQRVVVLVDEVYKYLIDKCLELDIELKEKIPV